MISKHKVYVQRKRQLSKRNLFFKWYLSKVFKFDLFIGSTIHLHEIVKHSFLHFFKHISCGKMPCKLPELSLPADKSWCTPSRCHLGSSRSHPGCQLGSSWLQNLTPKEEVLRGQVRLRQLEACPCFGLRCRGSLNK